MTDEEKSHYQKRAAYVVWMLKKWIPEAIALEEEFRKKLWPKSDAKAENNQNNLVAVQIMTKKSILTRIKTYEDEFDSGDYKKNLPEETKIQSPE